MKKILLSLVLLAGISSVSTFAAGKAPTVSDNDCYKGAAPGLILLSDDCKPARKPCSPTPFPACEEALIKRQMVNFVTIGGIVNSDSGTFNSFKAGESLKFVYRKKHESDSFSVTLLGGCKDLLWTARAPLTYGQYTGELHLINKNKKEKTILKQSNFAVNYTNDLVIISK